MAKRYPHDPSTRREHPNGAASLDSYRGHLARVERCPIAGTDRRATVDTVNHAGGACIRVRGRYVTGRLVHGPDGPTFVTPTGLPDLRGASAARRAKSKGLPSAALQQAPAASADCPAGGGPTTPARRSQGVGCEISPRQS